MALRATAHPSESESLATLVSRIRLDVEQIVRAEVHLVRLRAEGSVAAARAAGVGIACAVVLGLAGIGALVAGAILVIANYVPAWEAALAVGGALVLLASAIAAVKVRSLSKGIERALAPAELEERHG